MSSAIAAQVVRAGNGDAGAFAELVRAYERTALAVAFAVTGDASTAGDVTQDSFLRAWRKLGDLADPAKFGPWLMGIVRHAALDHVRAGKREATVILALDSALMNPAAVAPADAAERRERNEAVTAALAQLDETTRQAVVLRYFRDLSSKEIGDLLDLSAAAVDMRLSRARQELRRLLEPVETGRVRGEP